MIDMSFPWPKDDQYGRVIDAAISKPNESKPVVADDFKQAATLMQAATRNVILEYRMMGYARASKNTVNDFSRHVSQEVCALAIFGAGARQDGVTDV